MNRLSKIVRVVRSPQWRGCFELYVGRESIIEGDYESCRSLAADIRRGLKPFVTPTRRRALRP